MLPNKNAGNTAGYEYFQVKMSRSRTFVYLPEMD